MTSDFPALARQGGIDAYPPFLDGLDNGAGWVWRCLHCPDTSARFTTAGEAGYLAAVHDQLWHGAPTAAVEFALVELDLATIDRTAGGEAA